MAATAAPVDHDVSAIRERIYAAITGLATVLTLQLSVDDLSVGEAALSLVGAMVGIFAAGLVADVVAHSAAHAGAPNRSVGRQILHVSWQAVEVAVVPTLLILLSATHIWSLSTGLVLAGTVLALTQLTLILWGLRRSPVSPARKVVFLALQLVAILVVVGLKVVAH